MMVLKGTFSYKAENENPKRRAIPNSSYVYIVSHTESTANPFQGV